MKKFFALLLCLSMLLSLCTVAFAADCTGKKEYQVYTCLGDSVAAGTAQPKGDADLFSYDGDDFDSYVAALYAEDSTLSYRGYTPEHVPTAYHSLVANALGADLRQCARGGMRAVELRYMLTGEYTDPDTSYAWGNAFFDHDNNGFTLDDLDYVNDLYQYSKNIAEADIITLAIGSNDLISPTLGQLLTVTDSSSPDPAAYATAMKNMLDIYSKNFAQFKQDYTAIVDKIYELNPDVTLLCVGAFNPLHNTTLTASGLNLSFIATPFVDTLNTYLRSLGFKYGRSYIYVDVMGTPLYDECLQDPCFSSYYLYKLHPTVAGHQYMANKILDRVPGYFTEASCRRAALSAVCTTIIAAHIVHMTVRR